MDAGLRSLSGRYADQTGGLSPYLVVADLLRRVFETYWRSLRFETVRIVGIVGERSLAPLPVTRSALIS
ncbi:hypothetical protein C7374_102216 [Falsochrobactrum ovis]|uniref:Uncharacterized protein n=1 Tax=Falsochrobactrum ovis TaxID=1293442 RepID=A0A364JXP2_9HYPH|nr:hypothetical protein C7374_102216 [Falsochrobactrum ovis]